MRHILPTIGVLWIMTATVLAGCSGVEGSIPAVVQMAGNFKPALFVAPSNTPFLPARDTPTSIPTDPPTATLPAMATATSEIPPSWTPIPTETQIVLPSVTPVTQVAFPTQPRPTLRPMVYPTATAFKKVMPPPASTGTQVIVLVPTETAVPTATIDPVLWTPTNTLSGSETVTPLPTNTLQPTATALPTATRTFTPNPTNPFPGCTYYFNASFENQIFDRINQARAAAGLWPLTWYGPLASGAQYHSIDMGCNKFFAHTGGVYENILGGYNTVEEAWNWWWNSKPHHDNILGQYYYKVGVGYAYVPGSPYRYYWTIQFSK